jgi:hypothetical protein
VTKKAPRKPKNPHAVALGHLGGTRRAEVLSPEQRRDIGTQGGLIGGRARANSLSKARRTEIAKKAAEARWGKKKGSEAPRAIEKRVVGLGDPHL